MESANSTTAARSATVLKVSGMTCSGCARHVTEALQGVAGVDMAVVSLEAGQATVRWRGEPPADAAPQLISAVQQAGFGAEQGIAGGTGNVDGDGAAASAARWKAGLAIGVVVTAVLMASEWIFQLHEREWYPWFSLLAASIVQFGPGLQFYRGAWNQLKVGGSNMDTLVALGSTTAFAYSVWAMFSGLGGHLYFMEAAAIISLISLGHWAEARVSARAAQSLRALMTLAPATAWVRRGGAGGGDLGTSVEEEVPVATLQPKDVVLLRPGARVPTDGIVVEGASAVDESMLTGESLPVDKQAGAPLYAGTLNVNGRLAMTVTSVGEATALAQIVAAVQRAQGSRANIQRLGDRVSSVFVPVVLLVAILAGVWWGLWPSSAHSFSEQLGEFLWRPHVHSTPLAMAMITAASVLIIACPCAMGLATPAAIMAGANAAARRGILIRDGVALEKAGTITAVLFDKTGTITTGTPVIVRIELCGDATELDAVGLAAGLARHSTHPLAQAVAKLGIERGKEVPFDAWEEHRGAGLHGVERSQNPIAAPRAVVRLGSLEWLKECRVNFGPDFERTRVDGWLKQGATMLGLARGTELLAVFALKDTLKPGVPSVLEHLRRQGLRTYLVTGDRRAAGLSIGQAAGFVEDQVFAEVRPEGKAALVEKLQARGERIAFVGDGINDGPALEQADLGIAVSRASDVAREAADIVLLNSGIEAVPESLGLARATLRTIRQNLFWAFFYNALGIPLAALGFMSPVLCAAAMGLSDLVVIGNALRLLRWKSRLP